jgi:hypothetical protein
MQGVNLLCAPAHIHCSREMAHTSVVKALRSNTISRRSPRISPSRSATAWLAAFRVSMTEAAKSAASGTRRSSPRVASVA